MKKLLLLLIPLQGCITQQYKKGFSDGYAKGSEGKEKLTAQIAQLKEVVFITKDGKVCWRLPDGSAICNVKVKHDAAPKAKKK